MDIALLADAAAVFGDESLVQVDLGRRVHRNRPIRELAPIATEVLVAALRRAEIATPETVHLNTPQHAHSLTHSERPPLIELEAYRRSRA